VSELRRNPLTHEWVVIAAARSGRPDEYVAGSSRPRRPARDPECPFCPGNEERTPPTILALPGPSGTGWEVRVIENAYPALTTPATGSPPAGSALFATMPGSGAHEVIIECSEHGSELADRDRGQARLMLEAYRARYRALIDAPGIAFVSVFKNQGRTAGASLEHPHSQILALPVTPAAVRRRSDIAAAHRERTGRCLMCDVMAEELNDGRRVVRDETGFVTFVPHAPEFPGEMWVVPKAHAPSFATLPDGDLDGMAEALIDATRRLRGRLGGPDFNYAIHSPASAEQAAPHQHWYVQTSPRTTTLAGVELATGLRINPESPEEIATRLKGA